MKNRCQERKIKKNKEILLCYIVCSVVQVVFIIMASASTSNWRSSFEAYMKDITKCPICLEDFEDPRSLPCLHTFCLKCIKAHCGKNFPGDDVDCPVCRKKFLIPTQGIEKIQHNFYVEDLMSTRKAVRTQGGDVPCEGCGDATGNDAVFYCLDCREKLCDSCGIRCQKKKAGAHKVVKFGEELKPEFVRYRGVYCEKHSDQMVSMYCTECKANICQVCFADSHQGHKSQEVTEAAKHFIKQIQTNNDALSASIKEIIKKRQDVSSAKHDFLIKTNEIEKSIKKQGEKCKRYIDAQVSALLSQLETDKASEEKEMNACLEKIDRGLLAIESFINLSLQIKGRGTPCDISRLASDLNIRANDLMNVTTTISPYRPPEVSFTPSNIENLTARLGGLNVLVGQLQLGSVVKQSLVRDVDRASSKEHVQSCLQVQHSMDICRLLPQEVKQLEMRRQVVGVAELYGNTFVVCHNSNTIQTYDNRFELLPNGIAVQGLSAPRDLVACSGTGSLYIADWNWRSQDPGCVWRVSLIDGQVNKTLPNNAASPVSEIRPLALSITPQRLLVTSHNELLLFRLDGAQLERVSLPDWDLQHAIEISTGTFIVCHLKPQPQISEVNSSGLVIRQYSGQQQLKWPRYLSLSSQGQIFVADLSNHRVLLLSVSLMLEHIFLDKHHQSISLPSRLCYAQDSGWLAVGCWSGIGIRVFGV